MNNTKNKININNYFIFSGILVTKKDKLDVNIEFSINNYINNFKYNLTIKDKFNKYIFKDLIGIGILSNGNFISINSETNIICSIIDKILIIESNIEDFKGRFNLIEDNIILNNIIDKEDNIILNNIIDKEDNIEKKDTEYYYIDIPFLNNLLINKFENKSYQLDIARKECLLNKNQCMLIDDNNKNIESAIDYGFSYSTLVKNEGNKIGIDPNCVVNIYKMIENI